MAENVATQLTDQTITHTVNLLRFSAGLRRKVFSNLQQMEKELVAALAQIDPTGVTRSRYRQARLEELLRQTRAILKTNYGEIRNTQIAELGRMAALEQVHAARVLNSSIGIELFRPVITEASLRAMASDTILTMGASSADTVRGWWEQQAGAFEQRYAATVRQGMYRDEAMGQLVRRVRDLGVPTRRGAEALVRTSVMGVANQVNEEIIRSRPDVVNGVAIVTTLDSRISLICLSLTSGAWRLDTGEPLPGSATKLPFPGFPPLHMSCRSTMIAVIKSYSELGKSLEDRTRYKAALERLDDEQAKRLDGKLPIGQNYASWLAKQPASVQRHVLGPKRLALWKEGKIGLVDLIDQRTRALTIEELERL